MSKTKDYVIDLMNEDPNMRFDNNENINNYYDSKIQ